MSRVKTSREELPADNPGTSTGGPRCQARLLAARLATKPTGKENLSARNHVCTLGANDYIAVTGLRDCTGLALYDTTSNVGAMYHFGGQFKDLEPTQLNEFVEQLRALAVDLVQLHMWLVGSNKCEFANESLTELKSRGFIQTPTVIVVQVVGVTPAAFYLLGTGVVTNQLT